MTDIDRRSHTLGLLEVHIAVFLFGFAGLFGKFLTCSPLYIVFGRTFFGALTLWLYARLISKTSLTGFRKADTLSFMCQGVLLAAHWVLFFLSIQVSSVAVGLVSFSTFPLFVSFLEPLFFKERFKPANLGTAIMVLWGIILVVPNADLSNNITSGAVYGILSGLTFAILGLVNRRNVQIGEAVAVALYQNGFAALALTIPLLIATPELPGRNALPLLIILGVFCTALAHTLFIRSLKTIPVQTASVITGLEPVYGIILAILLLNEIPGVRTVSGGALIIGAAIASGSLSKKVSLSLKKLKTDFNRN